MDNHYDVIIVGAGLSGLAAADALKRIPEITRGPAPSFVILEGSPRCGGRTLTGPNEFTNPPAAAGVSAKSEGYLDFGGAYLGDSQSYAALMVERFRIKTFRTWLPRHVDSVYETKSGRKTYFNKDYPLTSDVYDVLEKIESLVLMVKPFLGQPHKMPGAALLDQITVADFAKQSFPNSSFGKELLTLAIRCAFSVEPNKISMLYLLHYAASCGSFRSFENVTGGGDVIRLTYGTDDLVRAFCRAVGDENIKTEKFVQHIDQDEPDLVKVYVGANDTPKDELELWTAKRVIVALSPVVSGRIKYKPDLPAGRRQIAEHAPMGSTIKAFLRYDQPWWRDQFTGYALSAQGPASWILDNTWQEPINGLYEKPSLMLFIVGEEADRHTRENIPIEDRKQLLVEQVERLFGDPDDNLPKPIGYYELNWGADAFAGGGPAGCLEPGILSRYGEFLRERFDRVYWAGSESATDWIGGYMNGALQAGIRAATEAIGGLQEGQLQAAAE